MRGFFFASLGSPAQPSVSGLIAASGKNRVQLVELYSSESCSSCPPADTWASSLVGRADLWKLFVPVVFHVDYWNDLGWKDGFSSDLMTQRQISLSRRWSQPAVYTPSFIVDGNEWRDWRTEGAHFPTSPAKGIELSIFKNQDGSFRIQALGLNKEKHYLVHAAQLGMGLSTKVTGGENSGRTLTHNFLVLDWKSQPFSAKDSKKSFTFPAPKEKTSRLAIAAWIEEDSSPTPLQSVGGYL